MSRAAYAHAFIFIKITGISVAHQRGMLPGLGKPKDGLTGVYVEGFRGVLRRDLL